MLMLLLYVGDDIYACDAEPIIEVVPRVQLKKIPNSPGFLAGLLNFGGLPVPVVDLSQLLTGRSSNSAMHTRIILFKGVLQNDPNQILGLIAEKVTETMECELSQFIEPGLKIEGSAYLGGIYSFEGGSVQFIMIDRFFGVFQQILKEYQQAHPWASSLVTEDQVK